MPILCMYLHSLSIFIVFSLITLQKIVIDNPEIQANVGTVHRSKTKHKNITLAPSSIVGEPRYSQIRVIIKLPNSEQSYKGIVKTQN